MRNKFLSCFLALCMITPIIATIPITAIAASSYGIYTYTVSKDEATITDCATSAYGSITIPSRLGSYPVTHIGDNAFSGCKDVTSITIPNSVTSIGNEVFYNCNGLESINVNESNKNYCSVDGNLFNKNKTKLIKYAVGKNNTSYSIPNTVTVIGDRAFCDCKSLERITIPDDITSIGNEAFCNCDNLTSITIPDHVTSIGNGAFNDCISLKSINVSENNQNYCSVDGNLFNKDKTVLFQYAIGKNDTSYIIPHTANSISDRAFCQCTNLTSITIPDSVTSIGKLAFAYCHNLAGITIPGSVAFIGDNAFSYCTALANIIIPNSVTSIGNCAFCYCTDLTSITIPNSVTSISDSLFYGCTALESITIPDNVTSIGNNVFSNCAKLTNITIPASVNSIGDFAFYGCSALEIIVIPDSVTSISDNLFYGCSTLESITIPDNVTSIGDFAFGHCSGLTSITIPDSVTSVGDNAFSSCEALTSVYYKGFTEQWKKIHIGSGNECLTNAIRQYAPQINVNYIASTDGNVWKTEKAIQEYKFTLTSDIPTDSNYTFLGWATASSSETAEYQPGDTITVGTDDITLYAVWESNYEYEISNGKAKITKFKSGVSGSITIPSTFEGYPVTSVGARAFNGCSRLKNVIIPDSITEISDLAFYGCSNLKSVSIPQSVTSIGNGAFYGCTSLTDVYYGARKEKWENIAVGSNNDRLTNANIYVSEIDINYVIDNSNNAWKMTAVKSSADATVITDAPSRTGYAFLGWATTADAKTAQYQPGDTITAENENITLYAVWKKIVYTDTVRADDIFIITPVGVPDGSSIIIACYKNDALVYTEKYNYDGRTEIPIIIDAEYDRVRVFVWNSIGGMIPITEAENINL